VDRGGKVEKKRGEKNGRGFLEQKTLRFVRGVSVLKGGDWAVKSKIWGVEALQKGGGKHLVFGDEKKEGEGVTPKRRRKWLVKKIRNTRAHGNQKARSQNSGGTCRVKNKIFTKNAAQY